MIATTTKLGRGESPKQSIIAFGQSVKEIMAKESIAQMITIKWDHWVILRPRALGGRHLLHWQHRLPTATCSVG